MMRCIFFLALVSAFACLHACAFCLEPPLRVSDEFYTSPLVLTGTPISSRHFSEKTGADAVDGILYTVRVDHDFRGNPGSSVEVFSEDSSGRFPMDLHQRYLLFLSRDDNRWFVDSCGNSGLLSQGAKALNAIRRLPLQSSFIYGQVYTRNKPAICAAMKLTVHSSGRTFHTTVGDDCTFHIDVPPGQYSASMVSNGRKLPSYDLPYKNPYCFAVPSGGSAGLAFRSEKNWDTANIASFRSIDKQMQSSCRIERK